MKTVMPKRHVITLRGAREHNLRGIDVDIPCNTLTVVTGVSGSGKSTLAFDVLFAEGQRRFLECMSAYARQFVEQLPRPELDYLGGIPPTIAIEQRVSRGGAKSTVATVTGVAQYLRLLYARVGIPHNPSTGNALTTATPEMLSTRACETAKRFPNGILLCAPLVHDRKGHHQPLANWALKRGYNSLRINGKITPLAKFKPLDRYKTHNIDLILTHLSSAAPFPSEVFAEAIRLGKGTCFLALPTGRIVEWLSTERTDFATGESFPATEPKNFSWNSPLGWCPACRGYGRVVERFADDDASGSTALGADKLSEKLCPKCRGSRLNPYSCAVKLPLVQSQQNADELPVSLSLPALLALEPFAVATVLGRLALDRRGRAVAAEIIPEINARLSFLDRVGLSHLALDRAADTLSGGEAQRVRLAAQLGSNLAGALYILDEPSIGLHPSDNARLISSLLDLRDGGNTVLVVEHDEDTLRAADLVLDLGPGAGIHGGHLTAFGTVAQIKKNENSSTAHYLCHPIPHPLRGAWRDIAESPAWLQLRNLSLRNLKNISPLIPVGRLCVVCGVSGSGKSTLVRDVLAPAATRIVQKQRASSTARHTAQLKIPSGAIQQVILVNQDPIGKTPRSTPATYIGAFDRIREHFASLPDARLRGHSPSFFSFNTAGGRCKTCSGVGRVKLEMSFLPDTYVPCDDCGGARYATAARDVRWNGKNIADVLAMSFEEAAQFFAFDAFLKSLFDLMVQTGLGYLTLGQSSPSLSGGEAQRLKLVSEIAKGIPAATASRRTGSPLPHNLYILEEPTVGLHQADCARLIKLLHALVDQGHTAVVIEHHLDLIAEADWVIELGPVGGPAGGHLLYQGNAAGLALLDTPTAPFLKKVLERPPSIGTR
ncbi:MAG: excinuclease ABC subunit UvrA [Puniceicoccales bacterium]|jgi:excinuclease ABC subunit A|nr:excinuclease ABC subunit UvrA [Puniceicoccales bacterium]